MRRVRHFLHELEVGSHAIRQPCHLTELRDENYLCSSLLIDAYNDWLVHICHVGLILVPEVLMVSCLRTLGIQYKCVLG